MDFQSLNSALSPGPGLLTEAWWDMVATQYRTTIMVGSALIGAVVAVTKTKIDDKIFDAVKKAMPWRR